MSSTVRLADIVGPLSVVADLGFGLPAEQAMRASLVATSLARHIGLEDEELRAAFYVPLLTHIGCISMSHETAAIFGNEIALTRAVSMTNLGDPNDFATTLIPEATRGMSAIKTARFTEAVMEHGATFGKHYDTTSTEVARQIARSMGFEESVWKALYQVAEAYDGSGAPQGLKGEDIALAAQLGRLSGDAAFFHHIGGTQLAQNAVRARAGTLFDPHLAQIFVDNADEFLSDARADDPARRLLEVEPSPLVSDEEQLFDVAAAVGKAADLKTPYTPGHSGATAHIAIGAAERLGLEGAAADVKIAALLHDVGRVAVSNVVWDRDGPLSSAEWEQVHMHPYQSERILARSARLAPIARLAGMHHEKHDGSGYHRGSRSNEIPMPARVVAIASAWVAMQQARPHRPGLDPDRAAQELRREADEGRADPQVVDAVLESAGQKAHGRRPKPAGLSEREVEVLRLLATGCSNSDIAARLTISRRTAEHHVQHIYTKIGVSTRPGATLFAVEHDLVEPLGERV